MEEKDDLVHKSSKSTTHGYFGEWSVFSSETDSGVCNRNWRKIPQKFMPNDPSDFSDTKKEKVALDTSFQLVVVES